MWCEIYFYESEKVSLSFHFAPMVVERYMLFMKKEKWFYANYNYLFIFFSFSVCFYGFIQGQITQGAIDNKCGPTADPAVQWH